MENILSERYRSISDIYFAVWNMSPPINFIWIDFNSCTLRVGKRDEDCDAVAERTEAVQKAKDSFLELISYDDAGKPVYNFDAKPKVNNEPGTAYDAERCDLDIFLCDMEDIGLLDWKCQYPSMREGLCWRIDVYYTDGDKHLSGQTRYPEKWSAFAKSLNGLVKKVQGENE